MKKNKKGLITAVILAGRHNQCRPLFSFKLKIFGRAGGKAAIDPAIS